MKKDNEDSVYYLKQCFIVVIFPCSNNSTVTATNVLIQMLETT